MPFTNEEQEVFKEAFSMFDADGSGAISTDELTAVFKKLGNEVTKSELHEMILEVDKDDSGEIDFGEFLEMMEKQKNAPKGSRPKGLDMLHQAVQESMVIVQVKKITKELSLQKRRILKLEETCDHLESTGVSKDGLSMILDARCPPLSKKDRRNAETKLEAEGNLESIAKQLNFLTTMYTEFVKETKQKDEQKDALIVKLEKRIKKLEGKGKKGKKNTKANEKEESNNKEIQLVSSKVDILQKKFSKLNLKVNSLNVQLIEINDAGGGLPGEQGSNSILEGVEDAENSELEELEYFKNSPIHSPKQNNGMHNSQIDGSIVGNGNNKKQRTKSIPISDWNGNTAASMEQSMQLLQIEQSKKMDNILKQRALEDKRNRDQLKNVKKDLGEVKRQIRKQSYDIIKLKTSMLEIRKEIEDTKQNISRKALELYNNRVLHTLQINDKMKSHTISDNEDDFMANDHHISSLPQLSYTVTHLKREIGIVRQSLLLLASPDVSPILCACHNDHLKQVQELDRMRGQVKALTEELSRQQHVHRLSEIHRETESRISNSRQSQYSIITDSRGVIGSRQDSRQSNKSLPKTINDFMSIGAPPQSSYRSPISSLSVDFQRNTLSRLSAVRSLNSRGSLLSRGSVSSLGDNEKTKRMIGTIFAENKRISPVPVVGALKVSPRFEFSSHTISYPNINVLAPVTVKD